MRRNESRGRLALRGSTPVVVLLIAAIASMSGGCMSLEYDLSNVPIPVSAKANPVAGQTVPLDLEVRNTLWVHGLFGHTAPDVAALLADEVEGYDSIANFRVTQSTNIHQWLLTHLSLTLIRMKTIKISGELIPAARP